MKASLIAIRMAGRRELRVFVRLAFWVVCGLCVVYAAATLFKV